MPKKEEFIAIFKAEAEEHVNKLNQRFVELEKDPNRLELMQELRVVTHTLKGSARVFGFRHIQEIAHSIENILDALGKKQLVFCSSVAEKVFEGLDKIRIILGGIAHEDAITIDVSDVCKGIQECLVLNAEDRHVSQEAKEEPLIEKQGKPDAALQRKPVSKDEEYVRVSLSRISKILNLSGEIVINKMKTSAKLAHVKMLSVLARETQKGIASLCDAIKIEMQDPGDKITKSLRVCVEGIQRLREESNIFLDNLSAESFHLDSIIDDLQLNVKELRMLPLSTIFEGFPRMVRDIASERAKEVDLEITGEETELDRRVLEGLKDPLIHLLRNCVDHGIEEPNERLSLGKPRRGTIKLSAAYQANKVFISVEDDGRGIDVEKIKISALRKNLVSAAELKKMSEKEIINIIFMSGFTSSPIITDVSGRGIGLDIVRRGIENLKGQVVLDAEKKKGTRFTLILPLTIAIIQVLLIKIRGMRFALPLSSINESLIINRQDIATIEGRMAVQVRGHTVPLVRLDELLRLGSALDQESEETWQSDKELYVVSASSFDKTVGFIVDEIIGEEEIFLKRLGKHLGRVENVSGAAILWTGEVIIVLNVENLLANSRLSHPVTMGLPAALSGKHKGKRILVVEDVISTRELEKSILEAEGYLVDIAVDGMDGLEKIAAVAYDLIISDVEMPRMDGFQFCENVKQNDAYKDIPVVIVTAMEKEEDKRRGIEVGASAYIIKTAFDQSNLLDTVRMLIG